LPVVDRDEGKNETKEGRDRGGGAKDTRGCCRGLRNREGQKSRGTEK
jgi:hypothetical protein